VTHNVARFQSTGIIFTSWNLIWEGTRVQFVTECGSIGTSLRVNRPSTLAVVDASVEDSAVIGIWIEAFTFAKRIRWRCSACRGYWWQCRVN
jgi:hypothetical protein